MDTTTREITEYRLFINGEWSAAEDGELFEDRNPATGELYARVHFGGPDDMRRAIAAADAARESWGATLANQREALLLRAADLLEGRLPEIADVLIDEAGSTFGKAMFESGFVVNLLRSAAGECRRIFGETLPADSPGYDADTGDVWCGGVSPATNYVVLKGLRRVGQHQSNG